MVDGVFLFSYSESRLGVMMENRVSGSFFLPGVLSTAIWNAAIVCLEGGQGAPRYL